MRSSHHDAYLNPLSTSYSGNPQEIPGQLLGNGDGTSLALATAEQSSNVEDGSVLDFLSQLKSAGISIDSFLHRFRLLDLASLGCVLQYLRAATFNGDADSQRLLLHMELMQSVRISSVPKWKKLIQEIRHQCKLSPESDAFVTEEGIESFLWGLLLEKSGLDSSSSPAPRVNRLAFLKAMFRLLESWSSLAEEDPNLPLLVKIINRYGCLTKYYSDNETPRRSVQRMAELGYDTNYIVFGAQDILVLGAEGIDKQETWVDRLVHIIKVSLGRKDEDSVIDIGVDRHKFYHQVKDDFETLKETESIPAGLRIIDQLLPKLQYREGALLRAGEVVASSSITSVIHQLHYLRNLLTDDTKERPVPQRLRAIRSPKLVPEILFDNARLACCLFKPKGLFHGEICRLLLNPATPLIEFWLDPYPEFLGMATVYPGANARGESTILMDTVDYDDRLLEFAGYNGTMRFLLNAMVVDASNAGAKKLVVFAAPYGKPLGFANFVKQVEGRSKSITYHDSYFFEAADRHDSALSASALGMHHYTVAFGYDQPMVGMIDYGYNLIGLGSVSKYYPGGRGVFEIDVKAFIEEKELLGAPPKLEQVDENLADVVFHRPEQNLDEEIRHRERQVFGRGRRQLSEILKQPRLEIVRDLSASLVMELMVLEAEAFEPRFRYGEEDFRARLIQKDAEMVLIRDGGKLVGFMLFYVSPILKPEGMIYLDVLAISEEFRSKGIGSAFLEFLTELAKVRGYRGIYVLTQSGPGALALTDFYRRAGFELLGPYEYLGQLMFKPLGIIGSDNAAAVDVLLKKSVGRLKRTLTMPKVMIYTSKDTELFGVLQSLEVVFAEEIRNSESLFRDLMRNPDAFVIVVHEQGEPIGVAICFHQVTLPKHTLALDTILVKQQFRNRGIGTLLIELVLELPRRATYTTALVDVSRNGRDGEDVAKYFERFGGRLIDTRIGKRVMTIPLGSANGSQGRATPDSATKVGKRRKTQPVALSSPVPEPEVTTPTEGADIQLKIDLKSMKLSFLRNMKTRRALEENGITSVQDLLEKAASKKKRETLARATGLATDLLLEEVRLAELARVGVPVNKLKPLKSLGINTLQELRKYRAGMRRELSSKRISPERLSAWQVRAKGMSSRIDGR